MSMDNKPIPPGDLSLKYLAWDMKRLANATEEICVLLRELVKGSKQGSQQPQQYSQQTQRRGPPSMSDDVPF